MSTFSCSYSSKIAVVVQIIPIKQGGVLIFFVLWHTFTASLNKACAFFKLSNTIEFLGLKGLLFGFRSYKFLLFAESNILFMTLINSEVCSAVFDFSCPVATHVFIAADTELLKSWIANLQDIF